NNLFAYVSHRIPEISDELYRIDDGMRAGFGWELRPFETWDAIGVKEVREEMKAKEVKVAPWIDEMLAAGHTSFYKTENGRRLCYAPPTKGYKAVPRAEGLIVLSDLPDTSTVWKNKDVTVRHLGDGILCASWST